MSYPSLSILAVLALAAVGCKQTASRPELSGVSDPVVATVNGVAILESELKAELGGASAHQGATGAVPREVALDALVQQELAYQKALEGGLEKDPAFVEELQRFERQLRAFKRKRLSELLLTREAERALEVNDDLARKYFEQHEERIRTELHVRQLLMRNEHDAFRVKAELDAGARLEEVALQRFPNLPPSAPRPWDVGFLAWHQVPEQWWGVVEKLSPGQASGLISGPNGRYWVIELVATRRNAELTFEQARAQVINLLKTSTTAAARERVLSQLREAATVVYHHGDKRAAQ